jgi:hypothetical protein
MVIGELYVKVDDRNLVMLPSGMLVSVDNREITPTDRPFVPLTKSEAVAEMKAHEFKKFKTAETEHYAYLYGCSDEYLQTTQDILESMYDGVQELLRTWKLPVSEPTVPLVVVIFGDRKSFDAYDSVPPGVMAYYEIGSNHIVLYEDARLAAAEPEFGLRKAAGTVAHEGVHQLLNNVGVQARLSRWPLWVTEGMAEYLSPIKLTSSMVKKGGDTVMPARKLKWNKGGVMNDIRMHHLLQIPQTGGKIQEIMTTKDLTSEGYALAWGLTHYLMTKQGDEFREYLRELTTLKPKDDLAPDYQERVESMFTRRFGPNYIALEGTVAKYLKSREMQNQYRDPYVYQTHYVLVHTHIRTGSRATVYWAVTTSPKAAERWREQQEEKHPGGKHGFRTEVCKSEKDAELLLQQLMSK